MNKLGIILWGIKIKAAGTIAVAGAIAIALLIISRSGPAAI